LREGTATFSGGRLDPIYAAGSDAGNFGVLIFDSLTTFRNGQPGPKVADRWEIASDGLSWTFYIHKGIKFHNGEDLTADDVKFSLDRYCSKESLQTWIRDAIDHVEVVDDYTVRVFTKGSQPYLAHITDSYYLSGRIMPKDYFQKVGQQYFEQHPIGSGPFKFVSLVPGDMAEAEAVTNNFRVVPAFKTIQIIIIPEETTRVACLRTGVLDLTECGLDSAQELDTAGFRVVAFGHSLDNIFFWGTQEKAAAGMPTADVRVRQALSLAINRDEIIKTFYYGKAGPPTPPAVMQDSADIDVPYWMDYAAKAYRYDPVAAKQLLTDAGYPNGFTFKLLTYPQTGNPDKLAPVVQGYWLRIGVKTEIYPLDYATFDRWRKTVLSLPCPPELLGQASTHNTGFRPATALQLVRVFGSFAPRMFSGMNPELDKLMTDAQSEINPTKRKDIIAKALTTVMDSYVALVIAAHPDMCALGPAVDIDFPGSSPYMGINVEAAKHRNP
jgi:peptide/nickel transport system substrate-binding protein